MVSDSDPHFRKSRKGDKLKAMKAKSVNLYQQVLMGAETVAKSLQVMGCQGSEWGVKSEECYGSDLGVVESK